jgi:hypothetical protein
MEGRIHLLQEIQVDVAVVAAVKPVVQGVMWVDMEL